MFVSIGFGELTVPDGVHITHLSKDADEALDVAVAFIAEGLTNNESICIVTPDAEVEKIFASLRQRKFDVNGFQKAGRLYFSNGMKTPRSQAGHYSRHLWRT